MPDGGGEDVKVDGYLQYNEVRQCTGLDGRCSDGCPHAVYRLRRETNPREILVHGKDVDVGALVAQ
jgi:hypothetical protein